jgi:hypothetical protein
MRGKGVAGDLPRTSITLVPAHRVEIINMDASWLPFIKLFGFFGLIIGWAVHELVKTRRDIKSKG